MSDIIDIVKESDGSMTIKAWGTVDIRDKHGQRIPYDELSKDAPFMMMNQPKSHWGHTDVETGFIKDLQFKDKMTKEYGLKKGVVVTNNVPGNRRYLQKIQKKLSTGKYQMSIRGFSYAKGKDGDTELLKDIEGVNYAWVPKGANPEADTIEIDGVAIKKSDDDSLMGSPSFMHDVQKHMEEGLPYTEAYKLSKDLYNSSILKEEDLDSFTKGDDNMTDEAIKKEDFEELKKQLEELKKAHTELKEQHTSLAKEKEDIQKERDGLKEKVEKVETPEQVEKGLSAEDVKELIKADRDSFIKEHSEEIKKELLANDGEELIKALGYTRHESGNGNMTPILKSGGEKNEEFYKNLYAEFRKSEDMVKNTGIDDIPDYESMEKSLQGVDE